MRERRSFLPDDYVPPRVGPSVSYCTNKRAKLFDYELHLRGQHPMRGTMRANSEADLRRMLENRHPTQVEELNVIRSYRAAKT